MISLKRSFMYSKYFAIWTHLNEKKHATIKRNFKTSTVLYIYTYIYLHNQIQRTTPSLTMKAEGKIYSDKFIQLNIPLLGMLWVSIGRRHIKVAVYL